MNPSDRKGRVTEIISREAAQFIAREAGGDSLITVIRAESASHGDRVLVFVSIFPEEKIPAALAFLERHREAFSNHLKSHARLRPLPRIDFLLDNRIDTGTPLKS
ncbi:MAG TPA: ribosome-binding factor A [Candidatus Paceibacterota bacterium]|nr:ribosome-binding factor A [Candidatus Paceibacterota bacterium]